MTTALRAALIAAMAAWLAGCSEAQLAVHVTKKIEGATADSASSTHGSYKIGDPYKIEGVLYTPREDFLYDETGIASWYGPGFHGKRTANGDLYDMNSLTAAHPTLQMPCKVQVTNLENGRSIALIVNDRGPYKRGRIIDLSRRSAQLLGVDGAGTARVRVRVLPEDSLQLAALAGRKGPAPGLVARGAAPSSAAVQVAALPPAAVAPSAPPRAARPPSATASPESAVTVEPVRPTSIYVQAGAFAQVDNANRLKAKLATLGQAAVTPVQQGEKRLYRVRIGPLPTVDAADRTLGRVVGLGQSDARVVVD